MSTLDALRWDAGHQEITETDWNDLLALLTTGGGRVKSATYIVWIDGVTINATNGLTGVIDYSGIDASTVIQSAIDAINILGGGLVFVKEGTYVITATINLANGIHIIGTGIDGTLFTNTSGAEAFNVNGILGFTFYGFTLSGDDGIRIEGNAKFGSLQNLLITDGDSGVIVVNSQHIEMLAVHIQDMGTRALYITNDASAGNMWRMHIIDCVFTSPKVGVTNYIEIDGNGENIDAVKFIGGQVIASTATVPRASVAVYIQDVDGVIYFVDFACEGFINYGFYLDGASNIQFSQCWSAGRDVGITPWILVDSHNVSLLDCIADGGVGVNMYFSDSIRARIIGGRNEGSASAGLQFDNNSRFCLIMGATIRDNGTYGIEEIDGYENRIIGNNLRGNTTGSLSLVGTDTSVFRNMIDGVNIIASGVIIPSVKFQFQHGGNAAGIQTGQLISDDVLPKGWEVDLDNEWALAFGQMPRDCQQVVRIKLWGVGLLAPSGVNAMQLRIFIQSARSDEWYSAESINILNKGSEETGFGINNVIHWMVDASDDPNIDDIQYGDSLEIKVWHEASGVGGVPTDAVFRCAEIEYI